MPFLRLYRRCRVGSMKTRNPFTKNLDQDVPLESPTPWGCDIATTDTYLDIAGWGDSSGIASAILSSMEAAKGLPGGAPVELAQYIAKTVHSTDHALLGGGFALWSASMGRPEGYQKRLDLLAGDFVSIYNVAMGVYEDMSSAGDFAEASGQSQQDIECVRAVVRSVLSAVLEYERALPFLLKEVEAAKKMPSRFAASSHRLKVLPPEKKKKKPTKKSTKKKRKKK